MIKTLENLRSKTVIMTIGLVLYYLWVPPLFLMDSISKTNKFYAQYVKSGDLYALRFIVSFIVVWINYIAASLFLRACSALKFEDLYCLNKRISDITVLLMVITSIPLLYNMLVNGLQNRTASFEYMSLWRHHAIISGIFTIALISSLLSFSNGDRRNFLILLIVAVLPELVYGTRVSAFRIVFVLGIFLPWRLCYMIPLGGGLTLIGLARTWFNQYSRSSLYDYLILFFGDPINITLGTSILESNVNFKCGIDGFHFLRSFLPPLFVRDWFSAYLGDVTICINENGFGVGAPNGLGGSPVNDALVAPASLVTSTLALVCFMYVVFFLIGRSFPLLKFYLPILVISCAPYVMRNGMIATSNHMITVVLWVLIPLLFSVIYKFPSQTVKIR